MHHKQHGNDEWVEQCIQVKGKHLARTTPCTYLLSFSIRTRALRALDANKYITARKTKKKALQIVVRHRLKNIHRCWKMSNTQTTKPQKVFICLRWQSKPNGCSHLRELHSKLEGVKQTTKQIKQRWNDKSWTTFRGKTQNPLVKPNGGPPCTTNT